MNHVKNGILLILCFWINFAWANQIHTQKNHTKLSTKLSLISGMITPHRDARFVRLPAHLTQKTEFLQKKPARDVQRLIAAAKKDGVSLRVISAFRSYAHQKNIWQRKWNSFSGSDAQKVQKILRFSSLPALSRHHWGTDVDFNSLQSAYWRGKTGQKTLNWLRKNAPKFGFCEVYSGKRRGGYANEAWHWSHTATARPLQNLRAQTIAQAVNLPIAGGHVIKKMAMRNYVVSVKNC